MLVIAGASMALQRLPIPEEPTLVHSATDRRRRVIPSVLPPLTVSSSFAAAAPADQ
jgi:hypothetical protein